MSDELRHIASNPETASLAALTLAQAALKVMRQSGSISDEQIRSVLDNAVALHLQAPTGENPVNREAGAIVRHIAADILR